MPKKNETPYIAYPTIKVFAAAVHALNINNGYFKTSQSVTMPEGGEEKTVFKKRNMDIVLELLRQENDSCTDSDYTQANEIITYYQGKLIDLMSGKLNSYSQAACQIANAELVTSPVEIGLISSLPHAYLSSVKFDSMLEAKERAHAVSNHFGKSGENYQGSVKVISSIFSRQWFRYFHSAQDIVTNNVINFSSNDKLTVDKVIKIKGRIKDHVASGVTRLNYVKISVDAES